MRKYERYLAAVVSIVLLSATASGQETGTQNKAIGTYGYWGITSSAPISFGIGCEYMFTPHVGISIEGLMASVMCYWTHPEETDTPGLYYQRANYDPAYAHIRLYGILSTGRKELKKTWVSANLLGGLSFGEDWAGGYYAYVDDMEAAKDEYGDIQDLWDLPESYGGWEVRDKKFCVDVAAGVEGRIGIGKRSYLFMRYIISSYDPYKCARTFPHGIYTEPRKPLHEISFGLSLAKPSRRNNDANKKLK